MENNILPKNNKRNCIVFFGNPDLKEFPKLSGNKKKNKGENVESDSQSILSNDTVTT